MGFGFRAFNTSPGWLTLSSDGATYGYIGKATYVSTTPAGTSHVWSFGGYSTFTINWPADIIVAVSVTKNTGGTRLESMQYSGGTWTIKVYSGLNTSSSIGFFDQDSSVEVFCWGRPVSVSGFGMAMYDSSGALSADLSRPPLVFNYSIAQGAGVTSSWIPAYTKLAVIGMPDYMEQFTSYRPGAKWINARNLGAWLWNGSGGSSLDRVQRQVEYWEDDGGVTPSVDTGTCSALLIEASGLA